MRRRRLVVLPLVIGSTLGLVAAAPAVAGTQPPKFLPAMPTSLSRSAPTVPDVSTSAQAGFAMVDSTGTVDHSTSYNSAGGAVTVTPGPPGVHLVTFHGLGFPGGDVQVSAIDSGATCSVNGWGHSGIDLGVTVDCYDATGAAANETFDVLVTQPHAVHGPSGVFDYDLVFKSHGTLTGRYQFNSSHRTNSVTNPATGRYVVTMPGPGPSGASKGTVKVSAFGAGAGGCQAVAARATSAGEQISVACFSATGVPVNREFTIVYARANNLMGQNGKLDANAVANGTQALYQPAVQFDSKSGARISVVHLDRGFYEVLFIGTNPTHHFSGGVGDLQITPVANSFRRCGVAFIPLHEPFALVGCGTASGAPANTSFIVQLVFN